MGEIFFGLFGLVMFLSPAIAILRRHRNKWAIFALWLLGTGFAFSFVANDLPVAAGFFVLMFQFPALIWSLTGNVEVRELSSQ